MLRRTLASVAVVAGLVGGLFHWIGAAYLWGKADVSMQDWIVYYAAGGAARGGATGFLYDSVRFTQVQYAALQRWFTAPPVLHPFLYPPPYLLALAPLSRLSFPVSFALFLAVTGAAAVAALAWRKRCMDWGRGLMLLFFPAAAIDVMAGQNAFLSLALLLAGFRLLDRRPALAGAVLGVLAYKPQLFLFVPVALLAARAWRALAAAALAALVLVLASMAVFGIALWGAWLTRVVLGQDAALAAWFGETFLRGYGIYVDAALLGLPGWVAAAAQAIAALAAMAAVWWAYARDGGPEAKLAILLAATMLATPHLQAYDMVLLAAAAILSFSNAEDGIGAASAALFALVWVLPWFRPMWAPSGRFVVPCVLVLFLADAVARAHPPALRAAAVTP